MAEKEAQRKRIMVRNGHRLVLRNNISKARELLPPPTAEISEDAEQNWKPRKNSLKADAQR